MKSKVFCIGTLKTGTTSVGRALRYLGYQHVGYKPELIAELKKGNKQPLIEFAADYDAFDDWPWAMGEFYVDLDRSFPGSKFVYTDRDLISWARSYHRYFYCDPDWPYGDAESFDDHFPDLIIRRRDRKRRILDYFSARESDLLVIDVTKGQGWEQLCQFLGVPIPAIEFPHANKTERA